MLVEDKTFSHSVFLIESINYLACAFITNTLKSNKVSRQEIINSCFSKCPEKKALMPDQNGTDNDAPSTCAMHPEDVFVKSSGKPNSP